MKVLYAYNKRRAHKLLPLLEKFEVVPVKSFGELTGLVRSLHTQDAVVLVDGFRSRGLLGLSASLLLRVPLVLRLRGEFFREEKERLVTYPAASRWPLYVGGMLTARLLFRRASLVICNSRYLARQMAPHTSGTSVAVVHNPYTEPATPEKDAAGALPEGGLRLLTVTNLNLYSKAQPLIEALEHWVPAGTWREKDIHWVICGGGHHLERLRALVREKGLQDRVRVLGRVGYVSSLYEWCDVLVHPTRIEAFPNVVMEAMARGKPVVTNPDSCGVRELVFDGETGFVVDGAASFVDALRSYKEDPELRERHGRAGRTLVEEKFSVEASRLEMERVLEEHFPDKSVL